MIGILSDIHGNFVALEQVLAALDSMCIEELFCLGDVVGYYPQVNECCNALRERNVKSVMGNHDWYMAAKSFCPRSRSVNDCLAYQRKVISKENLDWIVSFPVLLEHGPISMVHGGWCDPIDEYAKVSRGYFDKIEGAFFASGHTHIQSLQCFESKTYCNPGSVGQPRDNDNRAAFATFDGERFALHRVPYDFGRIGALMDRAGFSGYYYGCLRTGAKNLCY
jgi:predicted phosphodiesterase